MEAKLNLMKYVLRDYYRNRRSAEWLTRQYDRLGITDEIRAAYECGYIDHCERVQNRPR